jgi:hypothetical protein
MPVETGYITDKICFQAYFVMLKNIKNVCIAIFCLTFAAENNLYRVETGVNNFSINSRKIKVDAFFIYG